MTELANDVNEMQTGLNETSNDLLRNNQSIACMIRSIVSTATSDSQIWNELLKLIADQWDAPYAVVRVVTQRGMVQEETQQQGLTVASWRMCVIPELTYAVSTGNDRSQTFKDGGSGIEISIHTVPVTDQGGRPCGAIAIATDAVSDAICDATRQQLSLLVGLCSQAGWDPDLPLPITRRVHGSSDEAESPSTSPSPDKSSSFEPNNEVADIEQATREAAIASRFSSIDELAFNVVNSIKTRFNCVEVGFGLVTGRRIRLLAISGLDAVYRKTPGAMRISQAMEECLDHGSMVYAQDAPIELENGEALHLPIHQRLRSMTKGSNCVSLILGSPSSPAAVLTLRRPAEFQFQGKELQDLQAQFNTIAEAIAVLQVARRGLLSHIGDALRRGVAKLLQTSHVRGITITLFLFACIGLLIRNWDHSIYLEARFSSPKGRIYSAPIDGRIDNVFVVPGQHVEEGTLLFEISTSELQRELDELRNQARQHRVRMVNALSDYDSDAAAAAKLLLDADNLSINKLESRIRSAKVYAENAGVLVRGEGHLRIGERIPYGEAICQVAPDAGCEIQLRLEDDQAGDVQIGMPGWFAAKGEPDQKLPIEIVRIERQAAVEDGRNLVSAWAKLDETVKSLPLGAEGYARIETGQKPGWWILLHKPLRKLRWYLWPV